jgi:hypothetical protein
MDGESCDYPEDKTCTGPAMIVCGTDGGTSTSQCHCIEGSWNCGSIFCGDADGG